MKSSSEEHKLSMTRSQQHSRNTNVTTGALPNATNTATQSTNTIPKKHSFGLGRFSLRRIFSPSSIGRTVSNKHRSTSQLAYNKDTHSESGSAADNKV